MMSGSTRARSANWGLQISDFGMITLGIRNPKSAIDNHRHRSQGRQHPDHSGRERGDREAAGGMSRNMEPARLTFRYWAARSISSISCWEISRGLTRRILLAWNAFSATVGIWSAVMPSSCKRCGMPISRANCWTVLTACSAASCSVRPSRSQPKRSAIRAVFVGHAGKLNRMTWGSRSPLPAPCAECVAPPTAAAAHGPTPRRCWQMPIRPMSLPAPLLHVP